MTTLELNRFYYCYNVTLHFILKLNCTYVRTYTFLLETGIVLISSLGKLFYRERKKVSTFSIVSVCILYFLI